MIHLIAWICAFCCLRQIACAFRHAADAWKEGCTSIAQSFDLLCVWHTPSCKALDWCDTSSLAWNLQSLSLAGLSVVLLKRMTWWSCPVCQTSGAAPRCQRRWWHRWWETSAMPNHSISIASPAARGAWTAQKKHLALSISRWYSVYSLSFCLPADQGNL